jgi:hypothetical protein
LPNAENLKVILNRFEGFCGYFDEKADLTGRSAGACNEEED